VSTDTLPIRLAGREDIPAIAALRHRIFAGSAQKTVQAMAARLELLYFENPWAADTSPLVAESPAGEIVAFVGRMIRPYRRGARTLCGATGHSIMLDPSFRGRGLGKRLHLEMLDGGQDFSFADQANPSGVAVWRAASGGDPAPWYNWYWSVVLRPSRVGVGRLGWRGAVRLTTPLTAAFDTLATRAVPGRFRRRRPAGECRPLDPETVVALLPECVGPDALYPVYHARSFAWLLQRLEDQVGTALRAVDACEVHVEPHGPVGWFVCAEPAGSRTRETVQVAALPDYRELVFAHLLHRAWRSGALTAAGRYSRLLEPMLAHRRIPCTLGKPWVMIHAEQPAVRNAFQNGSAFLSRFEGEWWMFV
jgi:GNAT superfamily N-acetyltransferase